MIKRIFFTKSHKNDRNLTFLAFGRGCGIPVSAADPNLIPLFVKALSPSFTGNFFQPPPRINPPKSVHHSCINRMMRR